MSSSNSSRTTNIKRLLQDIRGNTFLHDESTDTSLQPGEQYPITPHSYMANAHKQRGATVNQITELLQTKPSEVSADDRKEYNETKLLAAKWLFPYTVENPIGTQAYQHWKTAFNLAILQIVTQEFQKDRRITKEGSDLLQQGSTKFLPDNRSDDKALAAKGLQICQPVLANHPYFCRNSTSIELAAFCQDTRSDLQTLILTGDPATRLRAMNQSDRYQQSVMNQLKTLQAVSSHTAQVFLRNSF